MRALFCFLLLCVASGARSQGIVLYGDGPGCFGGEAAYNAEPHDAVRALRSLTAVTTDGFGARYRDGLGREVQASGAASVLRDGALAWRTPTGQQVVVVCPAAREVTVVRDLNQRRRDGVSLAVELGNETGDPGPLRYLDPSIPNVDKIGPDYEASARLGRSALAVRWRDFLPTDPAIAPRIFGVLDGRFPKRKGFAARGETAVGRVELTAQGVLAEDLPFEETLGREVPTLRHEGALEASGVIGPRHATGLRGAVAVADLARPSWSRTDVSGPDWRETTGEIGADHMLASGVSLTGDARAMKATGPGLADGSVLWAEVGANARRQRLEARASLGPSGLGGRLSLEAPPLYHADRTRRAWLRARASARRDLPEAAPSLPFWIARGYTGLASGATPLTLQGAPRPVESVDAGIVADAWLSQAAPLGLESAVHLRAEIGAEARRGETVLLPQFTLAPEAVAVSGPVQAIAASGAVLALDVSAAWNRSEIVFDAPPRVFTRATAWARAALPLAGDDAFRAARDREPTLRMGLHAEHSPDGLLRLDARLEWRAATRWTGWPEPDVPAALLLDLGLSRSFNDDRWLIALTGRNVLGAPEQTHPLGATLAGRLFVRAEARF